MSDRIDASFDTIRVQAADVVDYYLNRAVHSIDDHFGQGFAKENPELVAALVSASVAEINSSTQAKVHASALDGIASALEKIADSRQ
ncbi:hypothetical protein [Aeromonas veronii]|uniref:hypothetical protein n=1 Tax=Aeromonas veronii TaxID=654 RepID=UPI003CEC460E